MNEKAALYLFIIGSALVLLTLILKNFGIVADYTLAYIGIILESLSVVLFAYQKIKKK